MADDTRGAQDNQPLAAKQRRTRLGTGQSIGMTPSERSMRARAAAYWLHATHDPRETTRKAREVFLSSFERQVDPTGCLSVEERQRRAETARRAHFTTLALKSARVRRARMRTSVGEARAATEDAAGV